MNRVMGEMIPDIRFRHLFYHCLEDTVVESNIIDSHVYGMCNSCSPLKESSKAHSRELVSDSSSPQAITYQKKPYKGRKKSEGSHFRAPVGDKHIETRKDCLCGRKDKGKKRQIRPADEDKRKKKQEKEYYPPSDPRTSILARAPNSSTS
ncbi:hypothetical protein KCU71_g53, partial [Aureobasidium melanogenum]